MSRFDLIFKTKAYLSTATTMPKLAILSMSQPKRAHYAHILKSCIRKHIPETVTEYLNKDCVTWSSLVVAAITEPEKRRKLQRFCHFRHVLRNWSRSSCSYSVIDGGQKGPRLID